MGHDSRSSLLDIRAIGEGVTREREVARLLDYRAPTCDSSVKGPVISIGEGVVATT